MNTELNLKQLTALIEKLRKPEALFFITSGAAILILIVLYFQVVYPVQARIDAAKQDLAEMTEAKRMAESLPAPAPLTDAMVRELAELLPSKPEYASFLQVIRELEQQTETEVLNLQRATSGEQQVSQQGQSGQAQMQDFLNAVGDEAEEKRIVSVGQGMQELRYEMTVRGSYDGLLQMMDRLRNAKRIIRLNDWNIRALQAPLVGTEDASVHQPTDESEESEASPHDYEMMVTLSFYYTDQYAEIFAAEAKE